MQSPILIVYNGGSRPGEERLVTPISVSTEELCAKAFGERIVKHFKLSKIAAVSLQIGESAQNMQAIPVKIALVPAFETLYEYAQHLREEFTEAGWNVVEEDNFLGVSRFLKNGKPRKTTVVSLKFVERSEESIYDFELGKMVVMKRPPTGRERPWRVDSERLAAGRVFSKLTPAAEAFVEEVRAANLSS
jgi:hypothetical protein